MLSRILSQDQYLFSAKKLIAKSIEELSFEEVLSPEIAADGSFSLSFGESTYFFEGEWGAWENLQLNMKSLRKVKEGKELSFFSFQEFCLEMQEASGMTDETLAQFIEEASQSLYCDELGERGADRNHYTDYVESPFGDVDRSLMGHPKILLNKGRVGWGMEELHRYSPESSFGFSLVWLDIDSDLLTEGKSESLQKIELYREIFNDKEIGVITNILRKGIESWNLIPVHPWQFHHYIAIQYQEDFARGRIRFVGEFGGKVFPQSTLRTLNSDRFPDWDIKVAVSILNTSCVRGIPGKYIESGHKISEGVEAIIEEDSFLKDKVRVLPEVYGLRVAHPQFEKINEGSYRYKELLGAVFRKSVPSVLTEGESAFPIGALLHRGIERGDNFARSVVELSGLEPKAWLKLYSELVIIPLYHFQVKHGLGLVAHGQNTILIHKKGVPKGLIIKDFHGDIRLNTISPHQDKTEFETLERLIPEYLIHDLFTGHFITVLRYLSRSFKESGMLEEDDFYQIVASSVKAYLEECKLSDPKQDLLRDDFERVLVNRVRFVAGYAETGVRLKPLLGKRIINPLAKKC